MIRMYSAWLARWRAEWPGGPDSGRFVGSWRALDGFLAGTSRVRRGQGWQIGAL